MSFADMPLMQVVPIIAGALGIVLAIVFWARLKALQRGSGLALKSDISRVAQSAQETAPSRQEALASHLAAIRIEVQERITLLESAQHRAAEPFEIASQEISRTLLVDRRTRFSGYRDALLSASIEIEQHVKRFKHDESLIGQLLDSVQSGRLQDGGNSPAIGQIEKAIQRLHDEALDDLVGELRTRSKKAEFNHVLAFREAMLAAEERLRDAPPEGFRVAKAAKPLTDE